MKIGICAGHSVRTPGAVAEGITEQAICRDLADRFARAAYERGWEVFDPRSDFTPLGYPAYLLHRIDAFNRAGVDCALDLHLNAWTDPAVNYSLTVYGPDREDSCPLAEALSAQLTALPWRAAGPRTDERIGRRLAFVRDVNCPAVVVEPLFLTSPAAREWMAGTEPDGSSHLDTLANLIAAGLEDWSNVS